jgi:hypothetical protein
MFVRRKIVYFRICESYVCKKTLSANRKSENCHICERSVKPFADLRLCGTHSRTAQLLANIHILIFP